MKIDIKEASKAELKKLVTEKLKADYEVYSQMYNGDHWRRGDGWVGPKPDVAKMPNEENALDIVQEFTRRVERQFVSKNVVEEVITRHINGVLSRKMNIQVHKIEVDEANMSDEQAEELEETERLIKKWIKEKDVLNKLREAVAFSLLGDSCVLRLFIPSGLLNEEGVLEDISDLESALDKVYVKALPPNEAIVYVDPDTMREYGIWSYLDDDEEERLELTYYDAETQKTIVRVMGNEDADPEEGEGFEIHGRIFMHEINRRALMNPRIRQHNDLINKNLTMWSANLDWSAFTERMILNGLPPGEWEMSDSSNAMEYKEKGQLKSGPSQTNYVMGQPIFDEEGNVSGMTNPNVIFRDPVPVDTFEKTMERIYVNILEECNQAHVVLNSEANLSGRSRREARMEFEDDLKKSKDQIDDAMKWIVETAMSISEDLTGVGGEDFEWDITASATLKVGALSSEEQKMLISQVDAKLKSVVTAMTELGIDDTDSELQEIDSISEHVSEIVTVLNEMGVSSPELVKQFVTILIQDKQEIFEDNISIEAIANEAQESANRLAQRNDIINSLDA